MNYGTGKLGVDMWDVMWVNTHSDTRNANTIDIAYRLAYYYGLNVQLNLGLAFKGQKELFTIMPKKTPETQKRAKWRGFVNITLAEGDKPSYNKFIKDNSKNFEALMQELTEDGHKITISWDSRSDCFMAAMRNDKPDHPNGGLCITSRSGDVSDVMWMSLFKHFVWCNKDWSTHFHESPRYNWG